MISSGVKTGCVKLESQVWGDRIKIDDGVQETLSSSMYRVDLSIVFYMIRCKDEYMVSETKTSREVELGRPEHRC